MDPRCGDGQPPCPTQPLSTALKFYKSCRQCRRTIVEVHADYDLDEARRRREMDTSHMTAAT